MSCPESLCSLCSLRVRCGNKINHKGHKEKSAFCSRLQYIDRVFTQKPYGCTRRFAETHRQGQVFSAYPLRQPAPAQHAAWRATS